MCNKNEVRVVAVQNFTFLIRKICKNECEVVR